MKRSALFLSLLGLAAAVSIPLAPAHAQATRTWVSGVGDDVNPCSRTAPCKTFAGAISKTAPAGEIDVLDPGGFGAVTITKSISIYDDGVGEAGVLVSGTNGIVISALTTDVINLRGLVFDGLNTGLNGVNIIQAGRVTISNCVIQEFGTSAGQAGILVGNNGGTTVNVKVLDTTIVNNQGTGGVLIKPGSGGTANVSIDRSRIDNNGGAGVRADGTSGGTVNLAINDSSMSLNGGNGLISLTGPGSANVSAMRDTFTANQANGVRSDQTAGGVSTVVVGESMFNGNVAGNLNFIASGKLQTFGTNQLIGVQGTGFSGPISLQ